MIAWLPEAKEVAELQRLTNLVNDLVVELSAIRHSIVDSLP